MVRLALLLSSCLIDILVGFGAHSPVLAQPAKILNLSLKEAIDRAEANNLQLVAARRSIPVVQAGLAIAGVRPNPRLAIDLPFGGPAETKRSFGLEQLVELGGKRHARIAVANDQIQQARLQADLLRWKTRTQVRQAYVELAIAQGGQQQTEQTLAINQQLVDIVKVRLAAGDVAKADVIQAQFTFEQAKQKLEPAVNRVHQATISLNALLNQPTETPINLVDGELFRISSLARQPSLLVRQKLPPLPVLKQLAKASRLDLVIARQQLQLNADQIALARSAKVSDVTLAGIFVSDPTIRATSVVLGVRVDLPLLNNRPGEVDQARANLAQAEAQMHALENQVDTEVAKAYADVESAERLLQRDRQVLLPQALEVLNLSRQSYQFGQTGLTDTLVVQQSVQSMFDTFYTDILSYQTALGALEQAVNQPLSTTDITNASKTP